MRAVVQRVSKAELFVDGEFYSAINKGMVALVGIKEEDSEKDVEFMSDKLINLRIFSDADDKLNLSVKDICGEVMIVSNFTIYGDAKKGRRPSYTDAARPEIAEKIYNKLIKSVEEKEITVKTGVFRASMNVKIENDGPVTLIIES